ncbi:unnamed protein product [Haemonchus placei]|uniref:Uncharacterized protein n=1 Tax=Haemonchus placei TaxID=6290 RepID=A0A0N4WZQ8_HAEPC|nr:unnamed protein product [Haemonchus placei]
MLPSTKVLRLTCSCRGTVLNVTSVVLHPVVARDVVGEERGVVVVGRVLVVGCVVLTVVEGEAIHHGVVQVSVAAAVGRVTTSTGGVVVIHHCVVDDGRVVLVVEGLVDIHQGAVRVVVVGRDVVTSEEVVTIHHGGVVVGRDVVVTGRVVLVVGGDVDIHHGVVIASGLTVVGRDVVAA